MTFSIAGRCARTGMLGAVVTTSSMTVGSRCTWAAANVGAVLTQHRTDPRLGPRILQSLKSGLTPEATIRELERTEPGIDWRQLAVIAADGKGAVFSGARTMPALNARVGVNCAAAGNILRHAGVVDAMVSAFESNEDQSLPERLLRAIEAGHEAGGEVKPLESAGLLVVHRESFPFVDLRIDFHAQPLAELRSLWELYEPMAETYVVRAVEPDKAPAPG